ncbi:MAG: hypothetical protein L3J71_12405 [Victivallaceae bacterium]|nr:hypothetical protein [Victivallaceae bacterium]
MDILRYVSESFWEWLGELPVEFTALFSNIKPVCSLTLLTIVVIVTE